MDPPNLEWEPNDLIAFDSVDAAEGSRAHFRTRSQVPGRAPERPCGEVVRCQTL
jgi:hypothetical protein